MKGLMILGGLAAIVAAVPAAAAPVAITNRVLVEQRSAAPDGTVRISLAPAARVVPGDRIVYVLDYRNTGSAPVDDLVLNNPLPRGVAYRAPAAGSPPPEVSIDGQRFATLAELRVATAGGATRAATAADVTHVRWRVPGALAPGAHGEVSFQAILK